MGSLVNYHGVPSGRRSARVPLLLAALLLVAVGPAVSWAVTWPVPSSHEMLHGFADGTPNNAYKFHEGIDVLADGQGGQSVVVARAGDIVKNDNDNGGTITIKVNVGTATAPTYEYDSYLHISDRIAQTSGNVSEGTSIGKISTTAYGAGARHLHFDVAKSATPTQTDFLNPFLRFTQDQDKDPLKQKPGLKDTNNDKATLLVTESGDASKVFTKQPIKSDVDLIADVVDKMSSTKGFAVNPLEVGYYVKPLFDQGGVVAHGVKNATKPYSLARFDDSWFAGSPTSKFGDVYDVSRPASIDSPPATKLNHFIVTNTEGENGAVANVKGGQYWNTNARDDNAADTVGHANYAGEPDTGRNAQARFKDGEYEVHVMLEDVIHSDKDVTAGKLRLDNYKQTAIPGLGGAAAPQGPTLPLYTANTTPYVPKFPKEPSSAGIDSLFWVGDDVGIRGDQYYPDLLMPAYIFPHREKWLEDDPLANPTKETRVESDPDGKVPLTLAWEEAERGQYDVIIDYDRDGLFSWTLDGLGGFLVRPQFCNTFYSLTDPLGVSPAFDVWQEDNPTTVPVGDLWFCHSNLYIPGLIKIVDFELTYRYHPDDKPLHWDPNDPSFYGAGYYDPALTPSFRDLSWKSVTDEETADYIQETIFIHMVIEEQPDWEWIKLADAPGAGQYEIVSVLFQTQCVPEPATFIIWSLLAALGIIVGWRQRRRKRA